MQEPLPTLAGLMVRARPEARPGEHAANLRNKRVALGPVRHLSSTASHPGSRPLSLVAQPQRRAEQAGVPLSADGPVGNAMPGGTEGDELMRLVAQARLADVDPEFELRATA